MRWVYRWTCPKYMLSICLRLHLRCLVLKRCLMYEVDTLFFPTFFHFKKRRNTICSAQKLLSTSVMKFLACMCFLSGKLIVSVFVGFNGPSNNSEYSNESYCFLVWGVSLWRALQSRWLRGYRFGFSFYFYMLYLLVFAKKLVIEDREIHAKWSIRSTSDDGIYRPASMCSLS